MAKSGNEQETSMPGGGAGPLQKPPLSPDAQALAQEVEDRLDVASMNAEALARDHEASLLKHNLDIVARSPRAKEARYLFVYAVATGRRLRGDGEDPEEGFTRLRIEGDALVEPTVWLDHPLASNWAATITRDVAGAGGLHRDNWSAGKRERSYLLPHRVLATAVEFGADKRPKGELVRERWYGIIVDRGPAHLDIERYEDPVQATRVAGATAHLHLGMLEMLDHVQWLRSSHREPWPSQLVPIVVAQALLEGSIDAAAKSLGISPEYLEMRLRYMPPPEHPVPTKAQAALLEAARQELRDEEKRFVKVLRECPAHHLPVVLERKPGGLGYSCPGCMTVYPMREIPDPE